MMSGCEGPTTKYHAAAAAAPRPWNAHGVAWEGHHRFDLVGG